MKIAAFALSLALSLLPFQKPANAVNRCFIDNVYPVAYATDGIPICFRRMRLSGNKIVENYSVVRLSAPGQPFESMLMQAVYVDKDLLLVNIRQSYSETSYDIVSFWVKDRRFVRWEGETPDRAVAAKLINRNSQLLTDVLDFIDKINREKNNQNKPYTTSF